MGSPPGLADGQKNIGCNPVVLVFVKQTIYTKGMAKQADSQVASGITCLHSLALADIVMQSGKAKAILASVGTARARASSYLYSIQHGERKVTLLSPGLVHTDKDVIWLGKNVDTANGPQSQER